MANYAGDETVRLYADEAYTQLIATINLANLFSKNPITISLDLSFQMEMH